MSGYISPVIDISIAKPKSIAKWRINNGVHGQSHLKQIQAKFVLYIVLTKVSLYLYKPPYTSRLAKFQQKTSRIPTRTQVRAWCGRGKFFAPFFNIIMNWIFLRCSEIENTILFKFYAMSWNKLCPS